MNKRPRRKWRKPKNFLLLTLAGVINAVGVTMFLEPVRLYDSGISGTSILLSQISPAFFSLPFFLLVLNIPLFLYGFKSEGLVFTVNSIYTVSVYAFTAFLIKYVLPIDVSFASPLAGRDLLLCALFGGLISGIGSGLTIRLGGAIDGIEVMAVIFAKRLGLSVGSFVMIYNVLLYTLCGITLQSWSLPLYSIVSYFAALKTVDFLVEGIDRSKAAMIVTEKPEKICAALSAAFGQGLTLMDAHGYFSKSKKTVIYVVLNRFQIAKMRSIVFSNDENAFVSISEIADVIKSDLN